MAETYRPQQRDSLATLDRFIVREDGDDDAGGGGGADDGGSDGNLGGYTIQQIKELEGRALKLENDLSTTREEAKRNRQRASEYTKKFGNLTDEEVGQFAEWKASQADREREEAEAKQEYGKITARLESERDALRAERDEERANGSRDRIRFQIANAIAGLDPMEEALEPIGENGENQIELVFGSSFHEVEDPESGRRMVVHKTALNAEGERRAKPMTPHEYFQAERAGKASIYFRSRQQPGPGGKPGEESGRKERIDISTPEGMRRYSELREKPGALDNVTVTNGSAQPDTY